MPIYPPAANKRQHKRWWVCDILSFKIPLHNISHFFLLYWCSPCVWTRSPQPTFTLWDHLLSPLTAKWKMRRQANVHCIVFIPSPYNQFIIFVVLIEFLSPPPWLRPWPTYTNTLRGCSLLSLSMNKTKSGQWWVCAVLVVLFPPYHFWPFY